MAIEWRVRIVQDIDPSNPRTEWDCHSGRMICWHRRYDLGDEHNYDFDNFLRELACEADDDLEEEIDTLQNEGYDKLCDYAIEHDIENSHDYASGKVDAEIDKLVEKVVSASYIMLPLHLYDHSGITMSTGSFTCQWDSGQVGWIVCDKKTIDENFGGDRDKAEKALEAEVATYDQYLTGDVYGFIVEKRETVDCPCCERSFEWEQTDSYWGFYGSDIHENGIADQLGDDLTALAHFDD